MVNSKKTLKMLDSVYGRGGNTTKKREKRLGEDDIW